jgi:hypothetical protein
MGNETTSSPLPQDRQSQRFTGNITNTSIHDIVQLICVGRSTCRMCVKSGARSGVILFRDGEIVHAEHNGTEGEESLYTILSWELGTFECDLVTEMKKTINESWDYLLLESMRRLDAFYD